jgi:uncharacterized repeat protein (TIGR01451 family)
MHARWVYSMVLVALLLVLVAFGSNFALASTDNAGGTDAYQIDRSGPIIIDTELTNTMQLDGAADFFIWMREQADLDPAYEIKDRNTRRIWVYETLRHTAERSQVGVRALLDRQGYDYEIFVINNSILVRGGTPALVSQLAARNDIYRLLGNYTEMYIPEPEQVLVFDEPASGINAASDPVWNISIVNADAVWEQLGVTGSGVVVANIDTGVQYTHPALVSNYRGNLGGGDFSHAYNWLAPTANAQNPAQCGSAYNSALEPCDSDGHGTHTMGTSVGGDGLGPFDMDIGMAPDSQWIACMGCDGYYPGGPGGCSSAALTACAEWMLAPSSSTTNHTVNPDPTLAPDVVNNSWGGGGNDPWYYSYVTAWRAADIIPVFSAGNAGPGCSTLGSPGSYENVIGVGGTDNQNRNYTSTSRGPGLGTGVFPVQKPDIAAPGEGVRSAVPGNNYANYNGTSMAAPHVTGMVALLLSVNLDLDYDDLYELMADTAYLDLTIKNGTWCGGPGEGEYPNYVFGYGRIDAFAAVEAALAAMGDSIIQGQVTDESSGEPIAGADILATSADGERMTRSNAEGYYRLTLYSGTYELTATAFGYLPATIPDVVATIGMTTTQDIEMEKLPWYTVSGTVSDALTGWPLYAKINFPGYPVSPVWTNPIDGSYSVSLPEGISYTFEVEAWLTGYGIAQVLVGPLTADAVQNIALEANLGICLAPGYAWSNGLFEEFEGDFPPPGWTVVNNGGNCTWRGDNPGRRANLTGATGKFAIADSDACGPGTTMNTDLLSPIMDVSGLAAVTLEFAYDYWHLGSGSAQVDISADGGATWTNLTNWTANQRGPAMFSQDVTALVGGSTQVQVRFRYLAPGWLWWWQIDRFVLGDPVCEPPTDGGLVVGNVYDAPLGEPLTGAVVSNDSGHMATTVATVDPAVDDAFYILFSPSGERVFTATMDGSYLDEVVTVNVVDGGVVAQNFYLNAGYLVATPEGFEVTLQAGGNVKHWLTLENQGSAPAFFDLLEINLGYFPMFLDFQNGTTPYSSLPLSFEAAIPLEAQEPVLPEVVVPFAGVPAFGINLFNKSLVAFNTDTPGTFDTIGVVGGGNYYAGDFLGGDFGQLYVLDNLAKQLLGVNTATAAATVIGAANPTSGHTWTGLAGDPLTNQFYAASSDGVSSALYTVNPATGATTLIGTITSAPIVIDIAINAAGDIYGVEIVNDVLVKIDRTTAAGTLIGSLGFNANYAQGLDFDAASGTLYWAAYGDSGQLRVIDVTTGASALIGAFEGGAEIDAFAIATTSGPAGDAVPWLTQMPISGTVAAGASQSVLVTFDASVTEQPGTYQAKLTVINDTPYGAFDVPVTMHVTPPDTWGKLTGIVTSLGYCDDNPAPLEGALVTVGSGEGLVWTLETDMDGTYQLWLDAALSPLTVTVAAEAHHTRLFTDVQVIADAITTLDAGLRWDAPCVGTDPEAVHVTVGLGLTTTVPFTITNAGAADAAFDLVEANDGMLPMASTTIASTVPEYVVTIGDGNILMHSPLPALTPTSNETALRPANIQMLTHSASQVIQQFNSVHCGSGGVHADNSYLRVFHLPDFGINVDFSVVGVEVGIESASSGPQPATINLYTLDGILAWANLTLIGSVNVSIANQALTVYNIPITADAPAGSTLVVELFTPSGSSGAHSFFVGSNNLGQTAPTYLAAEACGLSQPTDTAAIGFPDMHMVMNVTGIAEELLPIPWLSEDPESGNVDADSAFIVDLTFDAGVPEVTQPGDYFGTLFVNSDDPFNNRIPVPVTMTVTPPDTWGKLMGTVQSLGYCDADPAPVAGLDVLVEGSSGAMWTLTTDADGVYQVWVAASESPLTVTVAAPDHEGGAAVVSVVAGETTIEDFDLRWLVPCVDAEPLALHATLELGATTTEVLTLTNTGAADTDWRLIEENLGPDLTGPPPSLAQLTLLEEGFEGVTFPPTGWTVYDIDGVAPQWARTTASANSGIASAFHNYSFSVNQDGWLVTPPLDIEPDTWLSFYDRGAFMSWYEYSGVWLSIGSCDPADDEFTELWKVPNTANYNWRQVQLDLSVYAGETACLAFRYGGFDAHAWYIDDVRVYQDFTDYVTWLAEDPASGNLSANTGVQVVNVDFDASVVEQPGEYYANLWLASDDLFSPIILPVTMTVTPPADWSLLQGTVTSLGYCDENPAPLSGAQVLIESWFDSGVSYQTVTDAFGNYAYWLPSDAYTVTVMAPEHLPEWDVVALAGRPRTLNFSLLWDQPCAAVSPLSIADTLPLGQSSNHLLTITNNGAGTLTFSFNEWYYGYTMLLDPQPLSPPQPDTSERIVIGDFTLGRDVLTQDGPMQSPEPDAPAFPQGVYGITHSLSQVIMANHTVACGAGGFQVDNSYLRVFNLADFGLDKGLEVFEVQFGIQIAESLAGEPQPLGVYLYTLEGPLTWANLTLIGEAVVMVPDQTLTHITVPVTGSVQAGELLVVELFVPDGLGENRLYIGSNNGGQTAPSYIAAEACGIVEPVTLASLGFGSVHVLMNVIGEAPDLIDIPWLSQMPETGSVPPYSSTQVTVTLDAGQVWQPGVYFAELDVVSNDPQVSAATVQVVMTATLPAEYGELAGTALGLGPCDDPLTPVPLAGAEVTVESATQTWTLFTDADGGYSLWLDAAHSPLTVTVAALDYVSQVITDVTVIAGETTVQDFALRPIAPCFVGVTPTDVHVSLGMGMSTTVPITLTNTGAGAMNWQVSEADGGFTLLASDTILVVNHGGFNTSAADAFALALDNLGYDYERVSSASATGIPATLTDYAAVLYAGVPSSGAIADQLIAYLDAGGNLLVADNDFGWSMGSHILYTEYFQATYIADAGSRGPIEGVDIMAGINLDISSDPWPDNFALNGPDAVGIFANTSPRTEWAGSRIEGNGYRAIYLAWDFHYADGSAVGDPVETDIVAVALGWLVGADVPWLDEDPTSGTVAPEATAIVILTFDASVPEVTQPGDYFATLTFEAAGSEVVVPVTMTVTSPDTWGKLAGLVEGFGYCDTDPAPLTDAVVFIESAVGQPVEIVVGLDEIWAEEFEADGGDFTATGPQDNWQWGAPVTWPSVCASGSHCWGTNLNGNYSNNANEVLTSPEIDLSLLTVGIPLTVTWQQAWHMESATFDRAFAEVSINGGAWQQMWAHTGDTTQVGWTEMAHDITAAAGGTVQFRWRLTSDSSVAYSGYYIDDIQIATPAFETVILPLNWALTTDSEGGYGLWLDEMYSPLTVTIAYEAGYEAQVFTDVIITGIETTTLNAALRWYQPCVAWAEDSVNVTLGLGMTTTVAVNIANTGAYTAFLTLSEQDTGFTPAPLADPLRTGGPDAFGYTFADSSEAFGPVFVFVDISAVGVPLGLGEDEAVAVALGFTFDYYNNKYTEVYVSSNGLLSFGAPATQFINAPTMPSPALPNNIIAVMWDDLMPGSDGEIYVRAFDRCPYGNGACLVVQYDNLIHAGGESAGVWQAILFRTGSVLMQYADVGELAGASSTTGIENYFGTDGLLYTANSANSLQDGLAVCFAYPGRAVDCVDPDIPWLTLDVLSSEIAADSDFALTLGFDASVVEIAEPGDYTGYIWLLSNDPMYPWQAIPVTMTVEIPETWVWLGGSVVGWDHCDSDAVELAEAAVLVQGADGAEWALYTDNNGDYGLWLDEGHGPFTITVSYAGYVSLQATGISVEAGESSTVDFELRLDAPCFSVTPAALSFTVTQGHSGIHPLTLHNDGAGVLQVTDVHGESWVIPAMTALTLEPGSSHETYFTFDASDLEVGEHQGTLVFMSNDPGHAQLSVPVTLTVLSPMLLVEMTSDPTDSAMPGGLITYVITLTNTSDGALMIDLANPIPAHTSYVLGSATNGLVYVEGPDGTHMRWNGMLAKDAVKVFTFSVLIDADYLGEVVNTVEVGFGDQQVSATVIVNSYSYGVELHATPVALTGAPGSTVTYTVHITNTGIVTDTFVIGATGTWTTTASAMTIELGAGATGMFYVTVKVPAGAAGGASDVAIITATSQTDGTVTDSIELTTTAVITEYRLFLPIIMKP